MSANEIKQKSVCEIVSTDTYSGNEPIIGGLFDSRMGVIENDKICKTCNQKNTFCPGHFGHIQLAKPVFYIQFFDIVRKILKCVCFRCSRLLMNPQDPMLLKMMNKKFSRQKRFEYVYKCCSKIKRCGQDNADGCGAKLPHKTIKENIGKIVMEWKDDDVVKKNVYNAEDILIILKRITEEESLILGFPASINKPENLICTVFPVPPPSVRPSVRNDTGQRCEDDLTHKLCDIIKTNNTLRQKIEKEGTNPEQIDYWYILLQFHIATFVDNQLPGIPPAKQRTGRPLRSLTERLKSKEGRIRGNLMGKRVDFSARSVITPDPNIDLDELGVPMKIAMNLTFPEVVNEHNIDEMYKLVYNGNDVYPGAKYIRKNDDGKGYRTIRIKNLRKDQTILNYGDIVDRHLRNGDYVLFNRQPSLHKMSMMAHKVRVMPYDTFRLNVCCTPSYNADYDGDEMNMHVPQSKQTEYELKLLASVPTQIISPRESSPIISVVQDIVVGLYRISKDNVHVNNKQYFNILAGNSKFTGEHMSHSSQINGAKIWKGRELLSSVLNPIINLKAGKNVVIENGVIKGGLVNKGLYQEMTYGLIHYVYNELGQDECKALFDNTQRLICDWLIYNGFSVGISDLIVNESTQDQLKEVVKNLKVDVYKIISSIHTNTFDNNSIMNNLEHFENLINQELDKATKNINNIGTDNINDLDNRMMNMINSKSKGNPINVSQMMGSVGQQSVEGKRIMYGFDNRTLPHFTKYDDGPESRGFVENSFIKGLTAQEFFFHAMGGREGLIDTAVKTSETGYIQRKLIKAMEDAKVNFDMTVRNASGHIIQFMYGEDSIDPIKLEKHHLDYLKYDTKLEDMEENYLITESDSLKYILKDDVIEALYKTDWLERMQRYFKQILEDREFVIKHVFKNERNTVIYHPIGMSRLIEKIEVMFNLKNTRFTSTLSPNYVFDKMEQLINTDLRINPNYDQVQLLGVVIRHYFSPKKIIIKHRFTQDAFDYLVESVKQKYYEALVHPSEMVGVVAAQSIGEPSTQLTLNSVEYNTEIVVNENGKLREYRIGEWIESRIANGDKATHQYIEKGDQIYAPIGAEEDIRILTSDENGRVFWDHVDAITRHLPINADGSNTLIRVTTMSGHECTVTKGESVLTRQNNKLLKSKGSDLRIGDYLPAMRTLPIPEELKLSELDLSEYISKQEYVYMSEVEKALVVKKECEQRGQRHWWTANKGTRFELPYTRSDGFVDAFIGIGNKPGRRMQLDNRPGCVYPKGGIYQSSHIPEKIVLDELFGFVIGAYLAEGCLTQYHVLISNNDSKFIQRVAKWADKYNIKCHYDEGEKPKGYSTTIRMHSLVLAELFGKLFQREIVDDNPVCLNENVDDVIDDELEEMVYDLHQESKQSKRTVKSSSRSKHLPVFLLGAPDECLKGLIDGYFSGDGSIANPERGVYMRADSVSKQLLENVSLILRKFGVHASIRPNKVSYKHAIRQGFQTTMHYTMSLNKRNSIEFANTFPLTIDKKQERLDEIQKKTYIKDSMTDIVPNVVLSDGQVIDELSIHTIDLKDYENTKDYELVKSIMESNVYYDKVVKIEEVRSNHTHVFDLTTRFSRNFTTKVLVLNDTFHLSGVASASKAVRGVPRIKELLSVSKNIKAPSLTIYLNDTVKTYKDANVARYSIETTFMKDLVTRSDIYYEPNNNVSNIESDQEILDTYNRFKDLNDECMELISPWILRLELDPVVMLDIGLTTLDINLALKQHYGDSIMCMFNDDNNERIIFRISLTDPGISDILTDLKALEYNIMEKIIISGIDKIKKVSIAQKKKAVFNDNNLMFKTHEDKEEYVLETDGTNLINVLANKYVDNVRTISNDITEIYDVLGIEAARQALYNEIDDILNSTTNVNHRHIALLVDTMTCKGYLLSVDRHGINRSDIGPLAKCSFEETADILIKAGVFGEVDKINGVSANIMLGQIANCGTGDTKIEVDLDVLKDMKKISVRNPQQSDDRENAFNNISVNYEECNIDFDYEFEDNKEVFVEKTANTLKVR